MTVSSNWISIFYSIQELADHGTEGNSELLNHAMTSASSRLFKRAEREIRNCPYGPGMLGIFTLLNQSSCAPERGPLAFDVICQDGILGDNTARGEGQCNGYERCITRRYQDLRPSAVASCVSEWARLRVPAVEGHAQIRQLLVETGPPNRIQNNVLIALTEHNNDDAYTAVWMSIEPRDRENHIIDEPVSCTQCDNLSFLQWPANLDHFLINVLTPRDNEKVDARVFVWA